MPTPPAHPPAVSRSVLGFNPSDGPDHTPVLSSFDTGVSPLNTALQGPSSTLLLIAADAVQFSLGASGSTTVTFPSLPQRDNTVNPLSAPTASAQQPLVIEPKDHLMFFVFVQSLSAAAGVTVGVAAQALDIHGTKLPGPFLGANAFQTFQAVVTSSGAASGFICALLLLAVG